MVFEVFKNIKPEFRTFVFSDSYIEDILAAVHVDT